VAICRLDPHFYNNPPRRPDNRENRRFWRAYRLRLRRRVRALLQEFDRP
jgi:hypothetical protein